MKFIGAVALFLCSFTGAISAQALIIPDILDGEVWQTTIVLTNTTATPAQASLSFFAETSGNATQAWNLPFLEVGSTQSIGLAPGETILLHTPGTAAALTQGWGQVVADPGVVAYGIFTKRAPGFAAQVETSPATAAASRILVPFDNTSGNVAAMALVNTGLAPETIAVTFRTTGGTFTQSTLANVPAHGHMAVTFPSQFAATAGQSGLAEFYTTSGTFAILAVSINPAGSLTTAPVYNESGPPIMPIQLNGRGFYIAAFLGSNDNLQGFEIEAQYIGNNSYFVTVDNGNAGSSTAVFLSQFVAPASILGNSVTFVSTAVDGFYSPNEFQLFSVNSTIVTINFDSNPVSTGGTVTGSMTISYGAGTAQGTFTGTIGVTL
jgi:hypothetical protein